jgi:hypothetical protein
LAYSEITEKIGLKIMRGEIWIVGYVLLLLIYEDDLVLLEKHKDSLQRHIDAQNFFYNYS